MSNKKTKMFLLFTLILIAMVGMSAATAVESADNVTDTSQIADAPVQEYTGAIQTISDNKNIIKKTDDNIKSEGEGTFKDLENDITGSDVKLTRDYIQSSDEGTIVFREDKSIDGDGHTITVVTNPFSIPVGHEVTFKNMIINGGSSFNIAEVAGSVIFTNVTFDKLSLGTNSIVNPKQNSHVTFDNCTLNEFNGGSIVRCTMGTYDYVTVDMTSTNFISPVMKYSIIDSQQATHWNINLKNSQFTINNDTTLKNLNLTDTTFTVNKGKLDIINCTFHDYDITTPVIDVMSGVSVNAVNSTFKDIENNGVFRFYTRSNADFKNCEFINCSNSAAGGAIEIRGKGTFNVDNCTFKNNTAGIRGGAISSKGTLTVKNSTFTGNEVLATEIKDAQGGNALYVEGDLYLYDNNMKDNKGKTADIFNSYATIHTPVKIIIDDVECQQGSSVDITATVTDNDGNTIDLIARPTAVVGLDDSRYETKFNFTIEDKKYNLTRDQALGGKLVRPITPELDLGTYTINAEIWSDELADVTVTPGTLTVTEQPVTNYAKLQSMVDEASDAVKVDIEVKRGLPETLVKLNKSVTIDLNGLTWNANNGQAIEVTDGATTTIRNGIIINVNNTDPSYTNSYGRFARITKGTLILENITITNCSAPDFSSSSKGSFIRLNTNTALTVNNCTIDGTGSRFVIDNGRGTLNINNTRFLNNKLGSVDSLIEIEGKTTLNNTQFINNTANQAIIYGNTQKDLLTIDNTTFENNIIYVGAPVYTGADTEVYNSVFLNNNVTRSYQAKSGGIYTNGGSLTVKNSTFYGNKANGNDGTIIHHSGYFPGDLTVTNSILVPADNKAAIYNTAEDNTIKVTANYNYWGNNTFSSSFVKSGTYEEEDEYGWDDSETVDCSPVEVKYWVVMNTSLVPEELSVYDDVEVVTAYNKYTDGTNYYDMTDSIPDIDVSFTFVADGTYSNPVIVKTDKATASTTYNVQNETFAVIAMDSTDNYNVLYATASKSLPQVLTLNDGNWTEYFNDDGTTKSIVKPGSELRFEGVFTDRNMNINIPVNITTADTQAVMNNCTITVKADNVNITGIKMNGDDLDDSLITLVDAHTTRIEDNNLTITSSAEKTETHAISITGGENNIIRSNNIIVTGSEDDVRYGDNNYVYTTSVYARASDKLTVDNNNITVKSNGKASDYGTIYGLHITGESSNSPVSDITVSNNNINTESDVYTYALAIDRTTNALIENNTITTNGKNYAASMQLFHTADSVVNNNTNIVKATNMGYGIIVNGYKDYITENLYKSENNKITDNTVNVEADDVWAIESVIATANLIDKNNVTVNAVNAIGIGLADTNNSNITGNNVSITVSMTKAANMGDAVSSYPTGIRVSSAGSSVKNSDNNNINGNNITINAPNDEIPAVNITSSNNKVTGNYLKAPRAKGDAAVYSGDESNTVEDNTPEQLIITEENYSEYFTDEGVFKADSIPEFEEGDEVILSGEFNDKNFIFNNKVQLTSENDQTKLNNAKIVLNEGASGSIIENIVMEGDADALITVNADNVTIRNNSLLNFNDDDNSRAIKLNGKNNTVTNNTLNINAEGGSLSGSGAVSNHEENNVHDNLPFNPKNTEIQLYDIDIYAGDTETVYIIVNDDYMGSVTTGTVKVYLDEKLISTMPLDDETIVTLKDLKEGTHKLKVEYISDNEELYTNTQNTVNVKVSKKDSQIVDVTYQDVLSYASEEEIQGALTEVDGTPVNGKTIEITINNKTEKVTMTGNTFTYKTKDYVLGVNNVTIRFKGDDQYNGDTYEKFTFTVETQDTMLILDDISDVKIADKVTVKGTLVNVIGTPLSGEKITIKFNTEIINTTTNNKGEFTYTTTAKTAGVNNVTVTYPGNTGYTPDKQEKTFNVEKLGTNIKLDKISTVKAGDKITVTGTLTDENSKSLDKEQISITINGVTVNTKTTNAKFTYTLTTGDVGVNNVTVTYAGSSHYLSSNAKTTFTVEKQETKITVTAGSVKYLDNAVISGKLADANNKALVNAVIKVQVNGENTTVTTDKNGEYKQTLKATVTGTNNVTVTYNGNSQYLSSNAKTTFNTQPRASKITLNKIANVYNGENITVTGKLTDETGNPLKNTWIQITNNKNNASTKTDAKGEFTKELKTDTLGLNNITVTYAGNSYYSATNAKTTYTTTTQKTKITINNIKSVVWGDTLTVTGKLTNTDNKAIQAAVDIKINGKTVNTKTDANGIFTVTSKTTKPENATVTATLKENSYYSTSSTTAKYEVTARDTKITINNIKSVSWGNTVKITGTFKDANGNIFKNTAVQASVNGGKLFRVKTDKNGVFTITTKTNKPMTGKVTVSFAGNTYYKTSNATKTYKVTARNTTFTINNIKTKVYGSDMKLTGVFMDETGTPFKNTAVNADLNGKTFKVKTDANGTFTINAKANKVGSNTLTMSFNANTYYQTTTAKKTFSVNPADTKITINKIANAKKGSTITITGTFKDQNNNPILNSGLQVNLNGKTFTVKTDNKGTYKITTKANTVGTNTITVSYSGSSNYKTSTAKTTYTVKA